MNLPNLNDLYRRITARFFPRPTPPIHGGEMHDSDYRISDGVDYSTPVIIPGWMRREAETNAKLRESLNALAAPNINATYRDQFSNPYRTGADLPIVPTTEDPLREWDWATRERVLSNCHAAYARNPVANAAVEFTTDFVVGDGFNLTCKNKQVEEILQAFIDNPDNAIREWERQAVADLQVDGELVLRYFGKNAEDMVVVPQRPWELQWIETEAGFFRRAETYHFQRYLTKGDDPTGGTETKPEDVPAADIQFVAINRHGYELRGRPDLYKMLPWLRADKDFLEDRVRQNKWRGALLWDVSVKNAVSSTIANIANRWRKPPSPGSNYVHSDNEVVQALSNPTQADDASTDGRMIRLMILIGARLPEYFFADGENANLASSTNQQLPALTKFEAYQQIFVERVWGPMFKRVLQAAIDAGELPEEVEEIDKAGKPVMEDATEEEYKAEQKTTAQEGLLAYNEGWPKTISGRYENGLLIIEEFPTNGANKTPMQPPAELPTVPGMVDDMLKGKTPEPIEQPPQKAKTIPTLEAFEVSYEPVTKQDLAALTNMLSTVVTNGWVSSQTAIEKLGFDPSIERDRLDRESKAKLTRQAQGLEAPNPDMQNMLGMKADMMRQDAKAKADGTNAR
jgi:hypothetical protein